ncbi:hypothetical protein IIV25_024L [Invertebrate iridovirus 25]|uniref:MSV199 domain-containing protein n=1 Tax=Invertebrate iridovirus 25 TaxID=1301280 RepID=W8W1H1_9VIRU|nr:hypothetical protein IIV25_024L [Invertebrate iridovirus 25]CCV02042.1 hypothetical protein IIV25_024L [Invertebrate iridovirus 25]
MVKDFEEYETNFLGIAIDTENGSNNPKINKALTCSTKLLDITQFIKVTKFKLNMVMFDYFWQVMVCNRAPHVGGAVLKWFGYEGDSSKQKIRFKTMLKRNNILYREISCKDTEIELYPTIKQEIEQLPNEGAIISSKFLIMEPDDLKMAIMQLKTKNGHTIRQYYIDLEKLLKMYTEYTLYFNHREASRKITDLTEMMTRMDLEREEQRKEREKDRQFMRSMGISLEEVKDQNKILIDDNKEVKHKLGIAVEDRAPLPGDKKKQERFVLIKRNDDDYMPYYTIRAQNEYTERRIKTQRLLFPQLEILLDFKANPNSKTLYVRIKDKLRDIGVVFEGNNIDLTESNVTEEELVEEMKVINESRRSV